MCADFAEGGKEVFDVSANFHFCFFQSQEAKLVKKELTFLSLNNYFLLLHTGVEIE